jgi:hypothetical protein
MASVLHEIVVDCRDAEAQTAWWSRVLGWPAVCDESGFCHRHGPDATPVVAAAP